MQTRIASVLLLAAALVWPAELTYQKPPREILDVLNAPPAPLISVNPSRDYAILMQPLRYPPIAEVAQPMLRLAGLRIDIHTNGPHLPFHSATYIIKRLADASDIRVAVPPSAKLSAPVWSPDGRQFAFTNTTADSIDLWIGDTATGHTQRHRRRALECRDGSSRLFGSPTTVRYCCARFPNIAATRPPSRRRPAARTCRRAPADPAR